MGVHSGYAGSEALNAITAPDAYSPAATIEGTPIDRVLLDVSNQAIYWQLKIQTPGRGGAGYWESAEKFMLPGSRVLTRHGTVGIRIRAAIAAANLPAGGKQAVVTVEAVT